MNPGAAVDFAREAANALRSTGRHTLIADCNAIAPDTVHEIAGIVEKAGGRFLDGGIIGPPPRGKAKMNLYVSGPGAADLEQLGGPQLNVHVVSERIADASALKMCYGALNKGTQALWLEVLVAAQRLGVDEPARGAVAPVGGDMSRRGARPISEDDAKGLSLGAGNARDLEDARLLRHHAESVPGRGGHYRLRCRDTPLGKETPENRDKYRSGKEVVQELAALRRAR